MSREREYTLPSGHVWAVGSCVYSAEDVIVPVRQLDGLSDEEIGRAVRSLVREARKLYAEECTEYVAGRKLTIEQIERYKAMFQEFADESEECRKGLDDMLRREENTNRRARAKATKRRKRQQVASNYDSLFVKIGRRDGFRCAGCETSDDLQIDHIIPVALDGTNDLSNLQLLCGPCNRAKSDRLTAR